MDYYGPMNLNIYERLSQVYDLDWGEFSLQYIGMIEKLIKTRHIDRAKILDLACGTGTLIIELARRGHSCYGIDRSPEMIEAARKKARGASGVTLYVQDMTNPRIREMFDLATCTFDSLNYVTDIHDLQKLFSSTAAMLKRGGSFIFDSNTHWMYRNNNNYSHAYELGGKYFTQRMKYDPESMVAETIFEFQDGKREIHLQRPYGLKELKPLLRRAGFCIVSSYSGFKGEKYNKKCERLICTTRKL